MTVLIALLITVLAFAFITYPLFKQRVRPVDLSDAENLHELQSKRDTTYSMLKELEFDFQSGILTEEDYQDLQKRYKKKAISTLRDIDNVQKGEEVEDEIEKQILKLRQRQGQSCPQCGAGYQEGDRFCSKCGTRLSQGRRR